MPFLAEGFGVATVYFGDIDPDFQVGAPHGVRALYLLAAAALSPVYELLGADGPGTDRMPPAGQVIGNALSYYMQKGGHGIRPEDWDVFRQFMRTHLQPP